MATIATTRKQRLRTLEKDIRERAETITKNGLQIGRYLIEIRDDQLWLEDGYESWNQYLTEHAEDLIGHTSRHATNLIASAEIETRIPQRIKEDVFPNPTASHLQEIKRLVPATGKQNGERGKEKDYSKLKKQDVGRVLKRATELAGDAAPSVRDVRKAVDVELGIDRSKPKPPPQPQIDLDVYLRGIADHVESAQKSLSSLTAEMWQQLDQSAPLLVARVAAGCDSLAEFLRSR